MNAKQSLFALSLITSAALFAVASSVTLDDAYVYLRAANNWLSYGLPEFNPGDGFNITTSPGWLLFTTAACSVDAASTCVGILKALTAVFLAGASWALWSVLKSEEGSYFLPFAVFFFPMMATLVGHDTALATFLGCMLIRSFVIRDRWLPLWAALFYLARGEGAILGSMLLMVRLAPELRRGQLVGVLMEMRWAIGLGVLCLSAWHLWHLMEFGSLLPATAKAKTQQAQAGWPLFLEGTLNHLGPAYSAGRHWLVNLFCTGTSVVGSWVLVRKAWPVLAWPVLHVATYTILGAAYYHWYFYPVELAVSICFVLGAGFLSAAIVERVARKGDWQTAGTPALALLMLPIGLSSMATAASGREFRDGRFESYVTLSQTMEAKAEALSIRGPVLLTHEIGIFGFAMPHFAIRDVVGLATPAESISDFWNWDKQVFKFDPDFLLWPFPDGEPYRIFSEPSGSSFKVFVRLEAHEPPSPFQLYVAERHAGPEHTSALDELRSEIDSAASLASGPGSPPEHIRIQMESGRVIVFAHAPSFIESEVPEDAHAVEIGFGYLAAATAGQNAPDGAIFSVYSVSGDAQHKLFSRTVDPLHNPDDRGLLTSRFGLPADVDKLRFEIDAHGHPSWDWTYWTAPSWLRGPEQPSLPLETGRCPQLALIQSRLSLEPSGFVDVVASTREGLAVRGWAADIRARLPAKQVVIVAGEQVVCAEPSQARPDVAAAHSAPELAFCGFEVSVRGGSGPVRAFAMLSDGSFSELFVSP